MEHVHQAESPGAECCHHGEHKAPTGDRPRTSETSGYTSPMHPEVIRDAPRDCPKCGMALEAVTASVSDDDNTELRDISRRFWISAVLTMPVLVFAMGEAIPGVSFSGMASAKALDLLELIFATPVVLWGAWPFFVRGWRSVVTRNLNMFTLIGLGVGVAYVYSLVASLFPEFFPVSFRNGEGQVAVYFEAAAVITTLVLLGQLLELRARSQTSSAIKVMRLVDTLVVDKTGTLTEGRPKLVTATPLIQDSETSFLRLAASIERSSEHPLAGSIVEGAMARGFEPTEAEEFQSVTGKGVLGRVEGVSIAVGNHSLMEDRASVSESALKQAEDLRADGQTVVFVAMDGVVAGIIGVADPIKESTPDAIRRLKEEGLDIVMLTGDNQTTAEAVAAKLGIDKVVAGVLPGQKADVVKELQAAGRTVAMAGDGINDAPALAQAQVGMAMGTGTDVAMESAGVTLVKGDLRGIVRARLLSRATMRNIKQNLFFAFVYNSLGVPLAAGILYPFFGILLSPMIAAAAMSLSSVSVITNALRLRSIDLTVRNERT